MKIKIEIPEDFGDELVQSVIKVQGNITDDVKGVINQALLAIESKAKDLSPVDTGRLRSSIHAVAVGKPDEFGYYNDSNGQTFDGKLKSAVDNDGTNTGMVGTNVEYAPDQEFGSEGRRGHKFLTRATAEIQPRLEDELKKYKYK
jgi:phage gpG-like protein